MLPHTNYMTARTIARCHGSADIADEFLKAITVCLITILVVFTIFFATLIFGLTHTCKNGRFVPVTYSDKRGKHTVNEWDCQCGDWRPFCWIEQDNK